MGAKNKDGKDRKKPGPFYCTIPGCPFSNKNMGTIPGLRMHQYYKHGIIPPALEFIPNDRRDTMSEGSAEIKQDITTITPTSTITDSTNTTTLDTAGIERRLDILAKMIPPNLCSEFPQLCQLSKRIEGLETTLESIKSKIPEKIVVNIPKVATPIISPPIIDTEAIAQNIIKNMSTDIKIDIAPLTDTMSKKLNEFTEAIKNLSPQAVETNNTIKTLSEAENKTHKNVNDYFDCPECRKSLLDTLQSRIVNNKEYDVETSEFLNKIREKLIIEEEGKNGQPATTDGNSAATEGDRSTDTKQGEPDSLHTSKENKTPDTVAGKSDGVADSAGDSQYDSEGKCISGWCLLRRGKRS